MAENTNVLSFILGEIPFLLLMTLLIYVFWIRPKRVEKHEEEEEKEKTWWTGDRILFNDGMIGKLVRKSSSYITVESGQKKESYERKCSEIYLNLSYEERRKEAWKKLSFREKILRKI